MCAKQGDEESDRIVYNVGSELSLFFNAKFCVGNGHFLWICCLKKIQLSAKEEAKNNAKSIACAIGFSIDLFEN